MMVNSYLWLIMNPSIPFFLTLRLSWKRLGPGTKIIQTAMIFKDHNSPRRRKDRRGKAAKPFSCRPLTGKRRIDGRDSGEMMKGKRWKITYSFTSLSGDTTGAKNIADDDIRRMF